MTSGGFWGKPLQRLALPYVPTRGCVAVQAVAVQPYHSTGRRNYPPSARHSAYIAYEEKTMRPEISFWRFRSFPACCGPMNRSGKIHALLSTARVANIPSVVSNVWLGVVMGTILNIGCYSLQIPTTPWWITTRLSLAAICLYVAGNFLNDWMDRDWDARNRPERALPRGLFTQRSYRNCAVILALAGIAIATSVKWPAGVVAASIAVCIVIYTVWHKRGAWAVIPMGLCRAFLPLLGAAGTLRMSIWFNQLPETAILAGIGACGLFCYIVGLSLSARRESKMNESLDGGNFAMIPLLLSPLFLILPYFLWGRISWESLVGLIPYIAWLSCCRTIYRRPIPVYVSSLLAGIPLVDWIFLLPQSLAMFTAENWMDPLSIACFTIPPLAFISALLLQRLAPAT